MNNLISDDQLATLKNQHGIVYLIRFNEREVSTTLNEHTTEHEINLDHDPEYPQCDFVFKKMDFDLFAASAALAQEKPVQALKMQMEATLIFGDATLLSDPVVLGSITPEFAKITKARSASLKKN